MLRVTVSGSFRRHMSAIYEAVTEFLDLGAEVLSPADPRIVDQLGDFIFVASDKVRSIKLVEDRHLEAIRASDLMWLVCPDQYVGQSAAMELGWAVAVGTQVCCASPPADMTLSKYVRTVAGPREALALVGTKWRETTCSPSFLIKPDVSVEQAHADLDVIDSLLSQKGNKIDDSLAAAVYGPARRLARTFAAAPSEACRPRATG